jgi:hypothetical protein
MNAKEDEGTTYEKLYEEDWFKTHFPKKILAENVAFLFS